MGDEILDIDATDPRIVLAEIDNKIRPNIESFLGSTSNVQSLKTYWGSMRHAYESFGIEFPVKAPDQWDNYPDAIRIYNEIKTAINQLKIDVVSEKVRREAVISLDETWRDKIHSYLENIRQVVERANLDNPLRDRILNSLNNLMKEIDRSRAPLQKFTDTLVQLCEGISEGAEALRPTIRQFERIIGAIVRLKTSGKPQLALPKPEDFGLGDRLQIEDQTNQG